MSVTYVQGDLLWMNIPIVQQCNCLTVKPHGLSQSIAERYPWANLYATRRSLGHRNLAIEADRGIPGTLQIMSNGIDPDVICFLAQWDYGRGTRRIPIYADTPPQREKWFQECLQALGALTYETLAFPYKIGCGLAGGQWTHYQPLIHDFAYQYHKHVYIVNKLTCP
jgi:hypothetical protein